MHLHNTVYDLQEISVVAAEADAAFHLQKSQWDEERLALDRRNNVVAEERNKLHHELCTVNTQLFALFSPKDFSCFADSCGMDHMLPVLAGTKQLKVYIQSQKSSTN